MPIINRIAEFHREMTEWRQSFDRELECVLPDRVVDDIHASS